MEKIISELKNKIKTLESCVDELKNYENYNSSLFYYDNIKELYDKYAFEEDSNLSESGIKIKQELLGIIPYLNYKYQLMRRGENNETINNSNRPE